MSTPIKRVLVTHPEPSDENSPYHQLARKFGLRIDFKPFLHIGAISTSEFRKQNIYPLDFSAIIFTNKAAIDHYFRICKDLRIEMPADTKYFCLGDAVAKYLQKYIIIRKRKLYVADRHMSELLQLFKKHTKDRYLFPTGDLVRPEITEYMERTMLAFRVAMVYQTVPSDLSGTFSDPYDLICFFSPASVDALFHNFPDYQQGETRIAVFGQLTAHAALKTGLSVDIEAPQPEFPSMTSAIESYLKQQNGS